MLFSHTTALLWPPCTLLVNADLGLHGAVIKGAAHHSLVVSAVYPDGLPGGQVPQAGAAVGGGRDKVCAVHGEHAVPNPPLVPCRRDQRREGSCWGGGGGAQNSYVNTPGPPGWHFRGIGDEKGGHSLASRGLLKAVPIRQRGCRQQTFFLLRCRLFYPTFRVGFRVYGRVEKEPRLLSFTSTDLLTLV